MCEVGCVKNDEEAMPFSRRVMGGPEGRVNREGDLGSRNWTVYFAAGSVDTVFETFFFFFFFPPQRLKEQVAKLPGFFQALDKKTIAPPPPPPPARSPPNKKNIYI